jgi:hypothetical protein
MIRLLLSVSILLLCSAAPGFSQVVLNIDPGGTGNWVANNGPVNGGSCQQTTIAGVVYDCPPTNTSSYFWDGNSQDSSLSTQQCNIGDFLNGTMQASMQCGLYQGSLDTRFLTAFNPPGSPNLPFLSSTTTGAGSPLFSSGQVPGFSLYSTDEVVVTDVAGISEDNETFGYYLESNPSNCTQLFAGDPATSTATFAPNGAFGFCLTVVTTATTFTTDINPDQFAVFNTNMSAAGSANGTSLTNFWIGVEDNANPATGDYDYNDTIVEVTAESPEPDSFGLFGLGLVGISLIKRNRRLARRRRSANDLNRERAVRSGGPRNVFEGAVACPNSKKQPPDSAHIFEGLLTERKR